MRRWTVSDVMSAKVVSVTPETPYKEIAEKIAQYAVSALPVVDAASRVLGIVSEADLIHKVEFMGLEPHVQLLERKHRRAARAKASGDVARDLMSSPAVCVSSGALLSAVARMMDDQRVKRLPVVDEQGHLVGIVSRRDLLAPYLRDDAEIREEILREVLRHTLWIDTQTVQVEVRRGVVTLSGTVDQRSTGQIAARLCGGIAGVVDVVDELRYGYDDRAAG